jgi:hypothetical protein
VAKWVLPGGQRVDIPRTVWFPSAMTIVSLFLAGLYLGTVVGRAPDAGAAYVTTLKGKVTTVNGTTRVLVPATTVTRDGKVVTKVPATSYDVTKPDTKTVVETRRVVRTVDGGTTVVPTTVTVTMDVPTTQTDTVTVTETVTTDTTDTGTTTTDSSSVSTGLP